MKRCPFCAEEIQDAAIVCKHCNRELPKKPAESMWTQNRSVASLLPAFLLLAFIGWCATSTTSPSQPSPSMASAAVNQTAETITATDLYGAYEANAVAADERFKGKQLIVTGLVKNIGKDIMDTPYVTLGGENTSGIFATQAMFSRNNTAAVASLNKGDRVMVQCVCSGKLGNVILRECTRR